MAPPSFKSRATKPSPHSAVSPAPVTPSTSSQAQTPTTTRQTPVQAKAGPSSIRSVDSPVIALKRIPDPRTQQERREAAGVTSQSLLDWVTHTPPPPVLRPILEQTVKRHAHAVSIFDQYFEARTGPPLVINGQQIESFHDLTQIGIDFPSEGLMQAMLEWFARGAEGHTNGVDRCRSSTLEGLFVNLCAAWYRKTLLHCPKENRERLRQYCEHLIKQEDLPITCELRGQLTPETVLALFMAVFDAALPWSLITRLTVLEWMGLHLQSGDRASSSLNVGRSCHHRRDQTTPER